jgi:hypothetical protein
MIRNDRRSRDTFLGLRNHLQDLTLGTMISRYVIQDRNHEIFSSRRRSFRIIPMDAVVIERRPNPCIVIQD